MDGRGVPLSIIVTGANRHDVSQLAAVLDGIVVQRTEPPERRNKHRVPMPATPVRWRWASLKRTATFPTLKGADRKPQRNGSIRRNELEDGLWTSRIAGSIAFARYSCATRSLNAASSDSTILQQRSLHSGKLN